MPAGLPVGIAASALLFSACGSVGDPLPPLAHLPTPVEDLSASQAGDRVLVSWTWPLTTTEGTLVRRLGAFTLWSVDVPGFGEPLAAETIDAFRRESLRVGPEAFDDLGPGDRVEVSIPLSSWRIEQRTVLALTASNRSERHAGYSNQVELDPRQPPGAAAWLEVASSAEGVALAWRGGELADEYALERAFGERGDFEVLGRLATTTFVDRAAAWGETYRYRLQSLRSSRAGWIAGGLSPVFEITARDTFAPAAPSDLRAVRTPESVELSWARSPDEDVRGYLVYRDGAATLPLVERTSASLPSVGDQAALFWVTALDASGNESAPSGAVTVRPAPR